MIAINYTKGLNEKYQTLITFDEDLKSFNISNIDNPLLIDTDKDVFSYLFQGKVSEYLDLLDQLKALNDEKDFLNSLNSKEAEFILMSILSPYLNRKSVKFANMPNYFYKKDNLLFLILFGLLPINIEDLINDDRFSFINTWNKFLTLFHLDFNEIVLNMYECLSTLPTKLLKYTQSEVELLCMIQVWYDNLHKNEDINSKTIKDKSRLYLASRPKLSFKNNEFNYKDLSRRININDFYSFISDTSIGKIYKIDKDKSILLNKLDALKSLSEIELDDTNIYTTPLGISIASYVIPKVLKIK